MLRGSAHAQSLCAEVQMQIQQELTLERQAFDARLKISNAGTGDQLAISNVNVQIRFYDSTGGVVQATTNPNNTNALFYYRVFSLDQINSASNGVVPPGTVADIHWLIIPAVGAGGTNAAGARYGVGALLSYTLMGESNSVEVLPDYITVRPMPRLTLDYFLPNWVYGDDPWTDPVEEVVPFTLGLRVRNSGVGAARNMKVDSAQPEITENELGLLIGFELLGCEVQGQAASRSLLTDFGTLAGGASKVARWIMTASLMGRFTNLTATFTHADDLGGELTSLIEAVHTHTLVRDVLVDLPGRDGVRDFLAVELTVYESEGQDTAVLDHSASATLAYQGVAGDTVSYMLQAPTSQAPFYVKLDGAAVAGKDVLSATRCSDGKILPLANAWLSKRRDRGTDPWEYWFHLFDVGGGGAYTVRFRDPPDVENRPPVLAYIGPKVTFVGQELGFLVEASDPDGTIPQLGALGLPAGATFTNLGAGQGMFSWTPQVEDYGVHPVRFTASDAQYEVFRISRVYVGLEGEPLTNGLPVSLVDWEPEIKDLWASSYTNLATVWWDSVQGMLYELYSVPDPFASNPTWQRVGARREGIGAAEDVVENVSTNDMRRFYRMVLAGEAPDERNVWGVIRRDVRPAGFTLVSPPVRTDRRFDGAMGAALAESLHGNDGGIGSGADEIYILQANGSWRTLYLDASGTWREADGQASTYELPAGQGLWVARRAGSAARLTFTGPIGNDGTRTNRLVTGWNLIGLSEGKELPLVQTLAGANPVSGGSEETADQLVIQNPDGSWRRLMYIEGWGAPYDGNWFDLKTFELVSTNEVFEPGAAYYYLRRGSPTDLEF